MYISVADNRGASTESYSNEGGGGGEKGGKVESQPKTGNATMYYLLRLYREV